MKTLNETIAATSEIKTHGDMRRLVGNSLLALMKGEVSPAQIEALSSGVDSMCNSLNAEIKAAKVTIELRSHGVELGAIVELGQRKLG